MLSPHARNEWLTLIVIGALLSIAVCVVGLWWLAIPIVLLAAAGVLFFRDPHREVPTQRGAVTAPADGRVSSIHQIEHFEPFGGSATCVRIFLSVLDVHINRSPCHGQIVSITAKAGQHLNALNPESAEVNESNLIVMVHPIRQYPLAAVRQVAGLLARTIVCSVREQQVVQRGERIGLIKLGSTTELYLPDDLNPQITVQEGQKVKAGLTVLATITSKQTGSESDPPPTADANADRPRAASEA